MRLTVPSRSSTARLIALALLLAAPRARAQRPDPRALAAVPDLATLVARPQSELADVVGRYAVDLQSLRRRYDAPDSPDGRARLRAFHEAWAAKLRALDFDRLSQEGKVDWVLLDRRLQHELALLDRTAARADETRPLVPFADALLGLQDTRRRLAPVDPRGASRLLTRAAAQADSLRLALGAESARPSKLAAYHAATRLDAVRGTLGSWYRAYDGYDPTFSWWVRDPYKRADDALKAYAAALRERVVGWKTGDAEPIVGLPIGAGGLAEELAFEMIPYTPEELIAIARREYAWSLGEMKRASREMGFGDDWKAAMEKVKETYVEPGKQPELIRDLARQAESTFAAHDWVTIPPLATEDWTLEMMSPERQRVAPFFLGGDLILVSYPTDGMTDEEKRMSMRGNNPHFSHATVFHELNPGHHLQGFMQDRYNPHRQLFSTGFWHEGQSLYWEMFLWDHGFQASPEDRVGALFWRMHRSARIIFSLGFHLGRMSPAQAIDFLVDSVGFERANAEGEVRRSFNGSYGPLYQAAYMLGGLQLRALHHEIVDAGKMTDRQFHDAVLQGGAMPIEMVRARLLKLPLSRDYAPRWKFAGPDPLRSGEPTAVKERAR
jgi:uncharacterized protein (DUF885 family)